MTRHLSLFLGFFFLWLGLGSTAIGLAAQGHQDIARGLAYWSGMAAGIIVTLPHLWRAQNSKMGNCAFCYGRK